MAALGTRPAFVDEQRRYDRVARAIDTYRERFAVGGPDPLGPRPFETFPRLAYDHVASQIRDYEKVRWRELDPAVPWYRRTGHRGPGDRKHRRRARVVRRRAKTPVNSQFMPEGTPGRPWWGCYVGERTNYTTPPDGFLPVAPLYAGPESATLIIGPPRSGKTSTLVIPTVLDAPAAMVSTSTKTDVLENTAAHRHRVGRVFLFDPTGSVPLPWWVTRLRWSPVVGSADFDRAVAMAHALGSAARPGRGADRVGPLGRAGPGPHRAAALRGGPARPRHRGGLPLDPGPRPA